MQITRPTTAQLASVARIRNLRRSIGHYEIAATEFSDGLLRMYFDDCRVSILSSYGYDGSHMAEDYGTRRIGRFGTVTVKRPVDLLVD